MMRVGWRMYQPERVSVIDVFVFVMLCAASSAHDSLTD